MMGRNIIVIGASAGGVAALSSIVEDLPADLNAAVFIVLHIGAAHSNLPDILARKCRLPVAHPKDGEQIKAGRVYVAPPDLHMILERGRVRLLHGPKENFTRPAVDPLFRSAAIEFGTRVVGIILTGGLDDGSAGLIAIKDRGGIAIVQDPAEAYADSMPRSAAACVNVDHICPIRDVALLVVGYDPAALAIPPVPKLLQVEHKLTSMEVFLAEEGELDRLGSPSPLTCPECGGVLYQLHDVRLLRFRCRAGHAMSARALLAHLSISREAAIWSAIRLLTEEADLMRTLAASDNHGSSTFDAGLAADRDALLEIAQRLRTNVV